MADNGEVTFAADWQKGTVAVGIRRPLAIEPVTQEIPIVEFLEFAARMQLDMCALQREASKRVARQHGILTPH